jgi:hypothetical protein
MLVSAIAHANQALDAIEKLEIHRLKPQRRSLISTSLFAFYVSKFVFTTIQSYYCKNRLRYSLRLETRAKITKKYTRNSVEEVYAYIKADIEEGLTYVTSDNQPKYHFNKSCRMLLQVLLCRNRMG